MTVPSTPLWLVPAQVGMLSNKRGSNTGADSIALQARYSNPRQSGDLAGTVRVKAWRTSKLGNPQKPELAWDSGWVGAPTTGVLPIGLITPTRGSAIYNGRLYIVVDVPAGNTRFIESAAIQAGGSVGPFRPEGAIPIAPGAAVGTSVVVSMCQVAGRLYVLDYIFAVQANIFYATINADGTVGSWTQSPVRPTQPGQIVGGQMAANYSTPSQGFLLVLGSGGGAAASTTVQNCGLNSDGSLQGFANTTALPAARFNGAVYLDTVTGFVIYAGGVDGGSTVQATIYSASLALAGAGTPGAVGAWSTQTHPLPTALNLPAIVVTSMDAAPYIFVLGGSTSVASAGGTNTTYSALLSNVVGVGQVGVWSAALAPAMPDSLSQLVAFLTPQAGASNESYVGIAGGTTTSGGLTNTTTSVIQQTGAGALTGAWANGVAAGLATGDLGTGAALVTNQDGSQDWTFLYGAFGVVPAIGAFIDGDQVQFDIYFTDVQSADISPLASTIIKIGQPPTLSSVLPGAAITNGQPTASFLFSSGAGGGPEDSWQVTVKDPQGVVVFDSGIRRDRNNSVLINPAPLLKTGVVYTFLWQAWSNDVPFNGATNTVTSTLAVTPTLTTPSVPKNMLATPDNANGLISASWLNAAPPATSGNRIYYRRSGQIPWRLLADLLGPTASRSLMDMLCLAVGYDFAVSQLDRAVNAFVESAHTSPISDDFETAGTTATLWHSLGTEAGTDNSIAYWTADAGVPTYAAHVLTVPAGARIRGGHADWTDLSPVNIQFVFATNAQPFLGLHASSTSFVRIRADGTNLHLDKVIAGSVTNDVVAQVAAALVNGTTYWLQGTVVGNVFTGKVLSDSANTPGAVIATVGPFAIPDGALQSGQICLGNPGSAAVNFGSANASVCTVTGSVPAFAGTNWIPNVTAGEPAFAWSGVNPYAGTYSLSIYNAIAAGQGLWKPNALTYQSVAYTLAGQIRGTGAPTALRLDTADGVITTGAQAVADAAWHAVSASGTPAANSLPRCVAQGQGTYYFDNVTMLQSGGYNATIDPSAYGCFLHLAGSGQSYKVSPSLKGQPSFPAKLDASITQQYGQLAPSGRYGPMNYNEIELQLFLTSYAMLQALAALMLQAQRTGGVIVYRDGFGARFTGVLDPAQGPVNYKQPVFRFVNVKLHQVADTLAPNVGQGSAGAIPALVFGSVPALDQAELLI